MGRLLSTAGESKVAFMNIGDNSDSSWGDESDDSDDESREVNLNNVSECPHIRCCNCQQFGHCASSCTNQQVPRSAGNDNNSTDEVQMLMAAIMEGSNSEHSFCLNAKKRGGLPESWLPLDNQSTLNTVKNKKFLANLRQVNKHAKAECDGGTAKTNWAGDMKGFPEPVWCNPEGIANIPSFTLVEKHFRISDHTMKKESVRGTQGRWHCQSVQQVKTRIAPLERCRRQEGRCQSISCHRHSPDWHCGRQVIQFVGECSLAKLARKTQNAIGRPSTEDFPQTVDQNQLPNCPMTRQDVMAAEDAFGPDLRSLKGKTVRRTTATPATQHVALPPEVHAGINWRQQAWTQCL